MNCSEAIDVMGDAIEGCLAEDARAGFEQHLEDCAACRTYAEQLRLTLRALENVSLEGENPRRDQLIATFRKRFRPTEPS